MAVTGSSQARGHGAPSVTLGYQSSTHPTWPQALYQGPGKRELEGPCDKLCASVENETSLQHEQHLYKILSLVLPTLISCPTFYQRCCFLTFVKA